MERALERAIERSDDHPIERSSDRAIKRSSDRTPERSRGRSSDRVVVRAIERPSDRATERTTNPEPDINTLTLTKAFRLSFGCFSWTPRCRLGWGYQKETEHIVLQRPIVNNNTCREIFNTADLAKIYLQTIP